MTAFCTASPPFAAALADLAISPVLAATQVNAALIEKGSPVWDRVKAIVTPYIPAVENFELKQPPNWAMAAQRHLESGWPSGRTLAFLRINEEHDGLDQNS